MSVALTGEIYNMPRKNDLPEVQAGPQGAIGHELMLQPANRRMNGGGDDHDQYIEYVRAHAAGLTFLSQDEERQLLRGGVARFAIDYDHARWIAVGIFHESGVGAERHLDYRIEVVLRRFANTGRRGKIDRHHFDAAAAIYRKWAGNGISDKDVRVKLKRMMEDNDWRAKRSRLTRSKRWYNKIPD